MGSRTSGPPRLHPRTVRAIYAAAHGPQSGRQVARYFGISVNVVSAIKNRRYYRAETERGLAECGISLFNYMQARKARARRGENR